MNNDNGFSLVPTFGDSSADILQHLDGQGTGPWSDMETCKSNLQQGVRPMLDSPSAYESIDNPDTTPIALKSAARTAHQVGLSEIASVVSTDSVQARKEMVSHLAENLAPRDPGPTVGPAGPSFS